MTPGAIEKRMVTSRCQGLHAYDLCLAKEDTVQQKIACHLLMGIPIALLACG